MEYQSTAMKNDQNEAEKIAIKGRQATIIFSDLLHGEIRMQLQCFRCWFYLPQ